MYLLIKEKTGWAGFFYARIFRYMQEYRAL